MRRTSTTAVAIAAACIAVLGVACGDDDDGGSDGASPEAAATASTDAALEMRTLIESPADETALGSLSQMHAHVQVLAQSNAGADIGAGGFPLTLARQAMLAPGCHSTDGTVTTYTDCAVANVTFSGTTSHAAETVSVDIAVFVDTSAYDASAFAPPGSPASAVSIDEVSVCEFGTLDFMASGIHGQMQFDINTTVTVDMSAMAPGGMPGMPGGGQEPVTTTQTNIVVADFAVTLTDGCPTGGTLTVTSDGGLGGDEPVVATYGPACGDVSVE